jgi:hypothetical protein
MCHRSCILLLCQEKNNANEICGELFKSTVGSDYKIKGNIWLHKSSLFIYTFSSKEIMNLLLWSACMYNWFILWFKGDLLTKIETDRRMQFGFGFLACLGITFQNWKYTEVLSLSQNKRLDLSLKNIHSQSLNSSSKFHTCVYWSANLIWFIESRFLLIHSSSHLHLLFLCLPIPPSPIYSFNLQLCFFANIYIPCLR